MRKRLAAALIFIALSALFFRPAGAGAPGLQLPTETLRPSPTVGGPIIIALEQVNLRAGPGTDYDLIGVLIANQSAAALGRSPGSTWIQIDYPAGPGGTAWVFSDLVTLNGATRDQLPLAEIPPTPTLEPTQAVVLDASAAPATSAPTRLPTFTAPPPYVEPTLFPHTGGGERTGFPPALLIIGLFTIGTLGLFGAFLAARR
jgi:uncharacterized protein YgiM (DUF1202 family)